MNPIKVELAERLGSVEEYYFSKKLREIDEMRAAGREVISLPIRRWWPRLPPKRPNLGITVINPIKAPPCCATHSPLGIGIVTA